MNTEQEPSSDDSACGHLRGSRGQASDSPDWRPQTLDDLCEVNPESLTGATPPDYQFRYLDISAVDHGRIDWDATQILGFAEAPSRARRPVQEGDVLLCTVRPGLKAHARIGLGAPEPLVCSTGFAVLRVRDSTEPGFAYHHLFGEQVSAQLRALETGSNYPAVNESDLKRVWLRAPSRCEQRRIAAVLDTVDEAIAKTDAVIAKLRQVRAGLLHDLLTRGLDENGQLRDPTAHPAEFKETEVGRIPREWRIGSLADLVPLQRPIVYGILMPGYGYPGGVPVIKVKDIRDGEIDITDLLLTDPKLDETYRRSRVRTGDLLFTIRGTVGRSAFVPPQLSSANITQDTARISLDDANPLFIARWLEMPVPSRFIETHTIGVAVRGINLHDVRRIPVIVPARDEQDRIAAVIAALEENLCTEGAARHSLANVRLGLLSDLLTGRVRVPAGVGEAEVCL